MTKEMEKGRSQEESEQGMEEGQKEVCFFQCLMKGLVLVVVVLDGLWGFLCGKRLRRCVVGVS